MDAQVPAVVAVMVTTEPGAWFDEAVSSLADQDYQELSVLVLATGDDTSEVTERVGRVLPDAFVRHLPGRPGYGRPLTRSWRWWRAPPSSCCATTTLRWTRTPCTSSSKSRSAPTPGSSRPSS